MDASRPFRWMVTFCLSLFLLLSRADAFVWWEDAETPVWRPGNASEADLLTAAPLLYFPPADEEDEEKGRDPFSKPRPLYEIGGAYSHSIEGPWIDPTVPAAAEGEPSSLHVTGQFVHS